MSIKEHGFDYHKRKGHCKNCIYMFRCVTELESCQKDADRALEILTKQWARQRGRRFPRQQPWS